MIEIDDQTTQKGEMSQYSFIFSKLSPSMKVMNNDAWNSLVTMLNFDIEGKEDCTKIIWDSTKRFIQVY